LACPITLSIVDLLRDAHKLDVIDVIDDRDCRAPIASETRFMRQVHHERTLVNLMYPNDFGAKTACNSLRFNDYRTRFSLILTRQIDVFVMPH
jgi:hypothetical protein